MGQRRTYGIGVRFPGGDGWAETFYDSVLGATVALWDHIEHLDDDCDTATCFVTEGDQVLFERTVPEMRAHLEPVLGRFRAVIDLEALRDG